MKRPDIKAGDIFVTGPGTKERTLKVRMKDYIILTVSKFKVKDREAKGTHAGIILSENGLTMEATIKGTLSKNNLFELYKGKYIIIFRAKNLDSLSFLKALKELEKEFKGEAYPTWKLVFYFFIILARFFNFGRAVCGEMAAFYLWKIERRHECWSGTLPEMLRDELRDHKKFEIVFEGILE